MISAGVSGASGYFFDSLASIVKKSSNILGNSFLKNGI